MSNSIKVVARFRPQNRTEIELGGQPIVAFESEDTCSLDVGCTIYKTAAEECDHR
jgi:kinesin family member 5